MIDRPTLRIARSIAAGLTAAAVGSSACAGNAISELRSAVPTQES